MKLDEEDNWKKLPFPYSWSYVNCFYIRLGVEGRENGIYVGIRAFEDRQFFLGIGTVVVQLRNTLHGEFTKSSCWKEITSDIFNKHYRYKEHLLKNHSQVIAAGYYNHYGIEQDDFGEVLAPPKSPVKVVVVKSKPINLLSKWLTTSKTN